MNYSGVEGLPWITGGGYTMEFSWLSKSTRIYCGFLGDTTDHLPWLTIDDYYGLLRLMDYLRIVWDYSGLMVVSAPKNACSASMP